MRVLGLTILPSGRRVRTTAQVGWFLKLSCRKLKSPSHISHLPEFHGVTSLVSRAQRGAPDVDRSFAWVLWREPFTRGPNQDSEAVLPPLRSPESRLLVSALQSIAAGKPWALQDSHHLCLECHTRGTPGEGDVYSYELPEGRRCQSQIQRQQQW